jgi:hypothetical protein
LAYSNYYNYTEKIRKLKASGRHAAAAPDASALSAVFFTLSQWPVQFMAERYQPFTQEVQQTAMAYSGLSLSMAYSVFQGIMAFEAVRALALLS